jgi:hypothetical protein
LFFSFILVEQGTGDPGRHSAVHSTVCCSQVWGQAPEGLGLLVTYWTLLYAATAFQEDKLHLD